MLSYAVGGKRYWVMFRDLVKDILVVILGGCVYVG